MVRYRSIRRITSGPIVSMDCPKCGAKRSVFVMARCPKCGKYYLSKRITDPDRFRNSRVKDICPMCGTDLSAWYKKHSKKR